MVDSVSNAAISTLLRTQSAASSVGIAALKNNAKATQAIINQLQKSTDQSKALTQGTFTADNAPSAPLPRGSLVDILA